MHPETWLACVAAAIQAGGSLASDNSSVARSKGLCGATQPANNAQKTSTNATAAAAMATGVDRKLCQTSPSKNRCNAVVVIASR